MKTKFFNEKQSHWQKSNRRTAEIKQQFTGLLEVRIAVPFEGVESDV